ncbi:MAG: polyprenyl synthetase family protein [Rickettsiales bacterium]|nr:polyprenyl synthetase family protein [Rickettsiales bacterium]
MSKSECEKNKRQVLAASLKSDLQKVDEIILNFSHGKAPLIKEIANHLVSSGGKRIRPIIVILSSKLCGKKEGDIDYLNLSSAIEMIHTATLLHDDVVDNSMIRRGKKTSNAIWDNKASILVGDYLFSVAFQLMVLSKDLRILDLLSKTSAIMADGEVMQLENSSDLAISLEKYFEIIFGKTAVLFSAAAEVGALMNNRNEKEIIALREFGKNLGIIFQIVDDMLDYSAKEEVLGKDLGNDFFEGKVTLPIILTYQKADLEDKKIIKDLFDKNLISSEKNHEDFVKILDLIEKYQGLKQAKEIAISYHKNALQNLSIFDDCKEKQDLSTILDYALSRVF